MGIGDAIASAVFFLVGILHLANAKTRRLLGAMFLLFAFTLALHAAAVYIWFDRLVKIPNLADLIVHLLGLSGIAALTILMLELVDRSRRWRVEATIVVAAGIAAAALFAASRVPVEAASFTAHYRSQTTIRGYWLIPAIYALVCLARLFFVVHGSRHTISRREVRIGLQIAAYGGLVFGLGYLGLKAVVLFAPHGERDRWATVGNSLSLVLGVLCLAFGFGTPLARRNGVLLRREVNARRELRRLRPIRARLAAMNLLRPEVPGMPSSGPLARDVFCADAHGRLQRRVIEIRDALLLLDGRLNAPRESSSDSSWQNLSLSDVAQLRALLRGRRSGPFDVLEEARLLAAFTFDPQAVGVEGNR